MSEKILDRIAKLLEQGNHPNTGAAEREAFFAKANALMLQHRIDEGMIAARRASMGASIAREPVEATMEWLKPDAEYADVLYTKVAGPLATLSSIQMIWIKGSYATQLQLFGYPDDIEYFRMLWTSAFLTFSTKLYPKYDKARSFDENMYAMATAGMKWKSIWQEANAAGAVSPDVPWTNCGRMKAGFRRECKKLGEDIRSHTQSHGAYRESYVVAFAWEIRMRVADLLKRAEEQTRATTGAELVLRSDFDKVQDLYGRYAGDAVPVKFKRRYGNEVNGERSGRAAGREADLSGGKGHIQNRKVISQ